MGLALDKCCCSNEQRQREYEDFTSTPDISKLSNVMNSSRIPIFNDQQHPMRPKQMNRKNSNRPQRPGAPQQQMNHRLAHKVPQDASHKNDIKFDINDQTDHEQDGTQSPYQSKQIVLEKKKSDIQRKFVYEDVAKYYNIGKEIGFGKFGVVRLVSKKSYDRKRFALKSITREKLVEVQDEDLAQMEKEFEILKSMDHPNIVKFYEMYIDDHYFHLVTEFCGGGELFEHIIQRGRFSEAFAAKIIKQILSAIKHLHDRNICHRDLKPENILFESKSKDAQVKLIDFGLAQYFTPKENGNPGSLMKTRIGTPYYMAPEVLDGAYDQACDMWSIGVITYCLLCGYPPFNAETDQKLFRKIKLCDYEFHDPEWTTVSSEAKQFIQALLQPNPKLRMKPEQALAHKWIKSASKEKISQGVLTRLAMFKKPTHFQKEILLLLSALLNSKELKEIRDTFAAIDIDSSGTISLAELCQAFKQAGQGQEDLNEIIKAVDFDQNGEINYSEFVSGSLDRQLLSKDNLYKVFKYLDTDNQNLLTFDSLTKVFKRKGDFQEDKFTQMMTEVGLSEPQKNQLTIKTPRRMSENDHSGQQAVSPLIKPSPHEGIEFSRFCEIMGLNNGQPNSKQTINQSSTRTQVIPQLIQALSGGGPCSQAAASSGAGAQNSTRSNSLF